MPTTNDIKDPFDNRVIPVFKKIIDFVNIKTSYWTRQRQQMQHTTNVVTASDAAVNDPVTAAITTPKRQGISQTKTEHSFLDLLKGLQTADECTVAGHKETLQEHLVFCMTWNLFLMRCGTENEQVAHGLLGLLHDIGKKASRVVSRNGSLVAYPYHGEISSTVCYGMYSAEHEKIVPYTTWDAACQAIRVHMCGYHSTGECEDQLMKWNFLRLETYQTREMLVIQSIADVYARKGETSVEFSEFLDSRVTFSNYIHAPFDSSFAAEAVPSPSTVPLLSSSPSSPPFPPVLNNRAALIMIRSINVQEKDDTVKRIRKMFEERDIRHIVISRDAIVEDFVKDNYPDEYEALVAAAPTLTVPIYKIYAVYSPDTETRIVHARAVTREIRDRIKRAIQNGLTVILDDPSVMFSGACDIFPDEVATCFKIAVDVRSNAQARYSTKYGDLQKQLNSMNTQGWEMLPPNSSCLFNCLRSCMSAKTYKSGLVKMNTAHLVFPVVFSGHRKFCGLEHFERVLNKTRGIWGAGAVPSARDGGLSGAHCGS